MVYNEQIPTPTPQGKSDKGILLRVQILFGFFGVLFVAVTFYLVRLQIVQAKDYQAKARKQYELKQELPATRGSICDRNGLVLASNTLLYSYAADPKCAGDSATKKIAEQFSKAFGMPKEVFVKKLKPKSHFVWLARLVDPETLKYRLPEKLAGLSVFKEPKRLYHHKSAAGQLIGTTDIDNKGIMGLELSLNKHLEGTKGYVVKQRDGLGGQHPDIEYPHLDPVTGNSVYLTIDLSMQFIAEEELRIGVEKNKAEAGLLAMMNPKTGELLAVAQYPPLDPGLPSSSFQKDQKLRIITDRVEPGSVFKIVTASAAFENQLVTPEQEFDGENGRWPVSVGRGKKIRVIVDDHPHGVITMRKAMAVSSNIIMAKVSNIVGAERFYKMARAFGFGNPTNIELPGEIRGLLRKPSDWSGTSLNTMAFGYEVGVTPLQLLCAYGVVANGGYLMKPYIVEKEVNAKGEVVFENHPQTIRQVLSPSTVQIMKELFQEVVDSGTAKVVQIPGFTIGGKTGTAKRNINGRYEQGKYTASFVGFYPVEDPKIVCLVMLDNPKGASYYGGLTSGPVFKAVAERLINTTDVLGQVSLPKAEYAHVKEKELPSVEKINKAIAQAQNKTKDTMLINPIEEHSPEESVVPNVQGYSVRKAISLLTNGRLDPIVDGLGVVISQEPAAGTIVRPGTKVMLKCDAKTLSVQNPGVN